MESKKEPAIYFFIRATILIPVSLVRINSMGEVPISGQTKNMKEIGSKEKCTDLAGSNFQIILSMKDCMRTI